MTSQETSDRDSATQSAEIADRGQQVPTASFGDGIRALTQVWARWLPVGRSPDGRGSCWDRN